MRIAFVDFCEIDFHAQSVDVAPLGGAQSTACYLSRSLARLGHQVFLISGTSSPGIYDGVQCISRAPVAGGTLLKSLKLDALVSIMNPAPGPALRALVGPGVRLILWNHHAPDQAGVQPLIEPDIVRAFDALVMVSQWQLEQYHQVFKIDRRRMTVLRNAIAPAFENRFPAGASILPRKSLPPVLAYTSTPFRGLQLLLAAFGHIRAAIPGARLRVFSSMKVYGIARETDDAEYGPLYEMCRGTPGVEYIGSVPQPRLAEELSEVMALAYPNAFPETSCISVLEAMASGCRIVTSDFAALPETTAGFARLIPIPGSVQEYLRAFVDQTVQTIQECMQNPQKTEAQLQKQVAYINNNFTWEKRAAQWAQFLQDMNPVGSAPRTDLPS